MLKMLTLKCQLKRKQALLGSNLPGINWLPTDFNILNKKGLVSNPFYYNLEEFMPKKTQNPQRGFTQLI